MIPQGSNPQVDAVIDFCENIISYCKEAESGASDKDAQRAEKRAIQSAFVSAMAQKIEPNIKKVRVTGITFCSMIEPPDG